MTISDLPRVIRLKAAVDAVADAEITFGQEAYVESYDRIRQEVIDAMGPGFSEELNRLFPTVEARDGGEVFIDEAQEAQRRLKGIAGWLQGTVNAEVLEEQIQANAAALAKEQTKQTGFS